MPGPPAAAVPGDTTGGAPADVPAGFRASAHGGARLVARDDAHDALAAALRTGTLHAWAATQPGARALAGRQVAWAVRLVALGDVVVRHSRHGGLFARLTTDVFLAPSRAPRELAVSQRLLAAGVRTPPVVGYATYSAHGPFCRADVVTSLVPGADLPAAWAAATDHRARNAIAAAVGSLVAAMARAGAVHPDLNVKNVLVGESAAGPAAWVLDVDRVTFPAVAEAEAAARNLARLERSVAKWQREHALDLDCPAWDAVVTAARRTAAAPDAGSGAASPT
ncbi:MAG: lipopolysaccharide kinase InaA family protein [Gemmatimonadota bacterium]|nr:lipopolysaccharide kinase InaA family protein [Gemmatimonadota bacterium]